MLLLQNPEAIHSELASQGILTRPKLAPSGGAALGVSIGTQTQMNQFLSALKPLLS